MVFHYRLENKTNAHEKDNEDRGKRIDRIGTASAGCICSEN
jgi:hypothetical protein